MAKIGKAEQTEARAHLREILTRRQEVFTILRHVSRSGMQREISCLVVDRDGNLRDITFWASRAIGWNIGTHGGVKVGGCGMDMGFHLVSTLAYAVFGDEKPTSAELADCPKWTSPQAHHGYGGYALTHRWV